MILHNATDSMLDRQLSHAPILSRTIDLAADVGSMIQKISALLAISLLSLFAATFPTLSKRITFVRIPPVVFFVLKHFGTGVILSTAFVHLLQDAFEILLSLEPNSFLGHWTGLIVLLSLCIMFMVEYVCMAYVENLEAPEDGQSQRYTPILPQHSHPSFMTTNSTSKDDPSHDSRATPYHDHSGTTKPLSPLCESTAEDNDSTPTAPVTERTSLLNRSSTQSLTPHLISNSHLSSGTCKAAASTTHDQSSVSVTNHSVPSANAPQHYAFCPTHSVEHAHPRDAQFFSGHHRYECRGVHASHTARARRTPSIEEIARPKSGAAAAAAEAAPCDESDCISRCGSDEGGHGRAQSVHEERRRRHSRSRSSHRRCHGVPRNLTAASRSREDVHDVSYQSEDEQEVSERRPKKVVVGSVDDIAPCRETPHRDAYDDDFGHHHHHHHHHRGSEGKLVDDKVQRRRQIVSILLLQIGIMLHSLIIGLTLSIKSGPEFTSLFIAIMFHQLFEGLSLGVRLAALPQATCFAPTLAVLFATGVPSGILIGRATLSHRRSEFIMKRTQGIMSALSAGTLIYASCIEMLAADLALDPQLKRSPVHRQLLALGSVLVGVAVMALLAVYA